MGKIEKIIKFLNKDNKREKYQYIKQIIKKCNN